MEIIKPLSKFVEFDQLVKEVNTLIDKVGFTRNPKQISLQVDHPDDRSDSAWVNSCGSLIQSNYVIVEKNFKYINPALKGTAIERWLLSLEQPVYRSRLLLMTPRSTYSVHTDMSPRFHIPVITNDQCFMCFPSNQIMQYMPADGTSYWVDTRNPHTFVNCSDQNRIHLVAVTDS
jgi:hypothetical protein